MVGRSDGIQYNISLSLAFLSISSAASIPMTSLGQGKLSLSAAMPVDD